MAAPLFANLPTIAGNGSGTAVAMATFGATKTFVNAGNGGVFEPIVTIEISNDAGGTNWAPIITFNGPGQVTLAVACRFARATVGNYRGGGAPEVDVGADTGSTSFANLNVPAGNGPGTTTDVSGLPDYKTVQIGGTFRGTVNIQISEDGTSSFETVMSFSAPGAQSGSFTAHHMRVQRTGVPDVSPGLPSCDIAASAGAASGGSVVQAFRYTVTGLEPDTSDFFVTLPTALASDAYFVELAGAGGTVGAGGLGDFIVPMQAPDVAAGDRTTTQFRVVTAFPLVAGDKIDFIVST